MHLRTSKGNLLRRLYRRHLSLQLFCILLYLLRKGIPYKYECPITIRNGENLYPDFTILDVKRRRVVYWEHLGRMGDMSYVSRNIWKLDEYKKVGVLLGINLFVTFESGTSPLGTNEILRVINEIILS